MKYQKRLVILFLTIITSINAQSFDFSCSNPALGEYLIDDVECFNWPAGSVKFIINGPLGWPQEFGVELFDGIKWVEHENNPDKPLFFTIKEISYDLVLTANVVDGGETCEITATKQ